MNKINAYLANWDVLKIVSPVELEQQEIDIVLNNKKFAECTYKDYHYIKPNHVYYFRISKRLVLGVDYFVTINSSFIRVNMTTSSLLLDFDNLYGYSGSDLGNSYTENSIKFALWCPHATKVVLEYTIDKKEKFIEMNRTNKGVFRCEIALTKRNVFYRYHAFINGEEIIECDPYAKYGYRIGNYSVASNRKFNIDLNNDKLLPLKHLENIIYETNVRDFTIHKGSNIKHKGQYLGLVEEGRKTKGGNPAGLEYLKFLGITMLQLQPICDIETIDEFKSELAYNWGYDPRHYFVLEGSYSSNKYEPTQAVEDFKKVVSKLHENNIRVSIDVVFNHMYKPKTQTLEKLVPYYFFRRDSSWKMQNHCGCGGDFASERMMGRKLIIDSLVYFMKEFGVDAFRFDLMGLIDEVTIKTALNECKKINPNVYFYGEGWSMGAEMHDKSDGLTMDIAKKHPEIGFFNDRFRNIGKGIGGAPKQDTNGFLLGNQDFVFGFQFIFMGSCVDTTYPAIFTNPSQSINYLECHDNSSLYDTIKESLKTNDEELIYSYLDLCNTVLLNSIGVPFIHAGQEIGFSKKNHHNTYNEGDEFNNFDYHLLDEKFEHAKLVKELIELRKINPNFRNNNPDDYANHVRFEPLPKGIAIHVNGYEDITIVINPSQKSIRYHLKEGQTTIYPKQNSFNLMNKSHIIEIPQVTFVVIK